MNIWWLYKLSVESTKKIWIIRFMHRSWSTVTCSCLEQEVWGSNLGQTQLVQLRNSLDGRSQFKQNHPKGLATDKYSQLVDMCNLCISVYVYEFTIVHYAIWLASNNLPIKAYPRCFFVTTLLSSWHRRIFPNASKTDVMSLSSKSGWIPAM